jgi:DNA processing protein
MKVPESRAHEAAFHWLALERAPRVGPLTMGRLIDAFGTPQAALAASYTDLARRAGIGEKQAQVIADYEPPHDAIRKDLEILDSLDARLITRWDDDYPQNLKDIYDPPAILFVRGTLTPSDARCVAVVGTRKPTRYGTDVAASLSRELVAAGVTIVSGVAMGIDTAAHRAALKAAGRTIGVLGCGINVVYPRSNKDLMEEMVTSGAVMTEFRPNMEPLPTQFYRRNRIVSGLAKGVVVVECGLKSGSLITVQHALDQNRDVFAVPGSVFSLRSLGPHALLRQGASLVERGEDVLKALFPSGESLVQPTLFRAQPEYESLSEPVRTVLEALDPDPIPIDALCTMLKIEPGALSAILMELEIKGLVHQHPGKLFSRVIG